MNTFKIIYQHREADRGQNNARPFNKNYQFVKADNAQSAEKQFIDAWTSDNEFEILKIQEC